jgi:nitrile hydratase beta subunit
VNSIHDMGGMDGFGPIAREADEPCFHTEWERRMFALAFAIPFTVPMNDDLFRQEIERIDPATYLRSTYYELWYQAHSALLRQRGVLDAGKPEGLNQALAAGNVLSEIEAGASTRMPAEGIVARFAIGDTVITRNINPTGHTRLPRYARGKAGIIHAVRGVFSFADSNARGDGPCPQHLYTVRFTAVALWGDGTGKDTICLDLWDNYLEPAPR